MDKTILIIGNKNYSSWSLRAWIALKHSGERFEEVRVPLFTEGYKDKILEYSPGGLVPAIVDGDVTAWESLSVCEYIAEKHPELWPDGAKARAHARSISAEMHAGFMELRNALPMNCRARNRSVPITPGIQRDVDRVIEIWDGCRNEYAGHGPWLFGKYSIADAMYAPVVFRFLTYGVEVSDTSKDYMDTVLSDQYIEEWVGAAELETEIIEEDEAG